jgi:hypothetical protein
MARVGMDPEEMDVIGEAATGGRLVEVGSGASTITFARNEAIEDIVSFEESDTWHRRWQGQLVWEGLENRVSYQMVGKNLSDLLTFLPKCIQGAKVLLVDNNRKKRLMVLEQ